MQEAFQQGFQGHAVGNGDSPWQVLPDRDFYESYGAENAKAYEALADDGQRVGGAIVIVNDETSHNELAFLYVKVGNQGRGIGQSVWKEIERLHPGTEVWKTCTPYFDRRNIHFYINCCGFHAVEFFNGHHRDPDMPEQFDPEDGLFVFEKRMR